MKVEKAGLGSVLLITLEPYQDFRGHFVELYNKRDYQEQGIEFVEDDINVSRKGVLKGFHSDSKALKLLTCLHGEMYLVIVDCREGEAFGKWQAFTLTGDSSFQLLVPSKYGIAFLALSDVAILWYKQTECYDPKRQRTYRWDDPRFGVRWPIQNPILSRRDECL